MKEKINKKFEEYNKKYNLNYILLGIFVLMMFAILKINIDTMLNDKASDDEITKYALKIHTLKEYQLKNIVINKSLIDFNNEILNDNFLSKKELNEFNKKFYHFNKEILKSEKKDFKTIYSLI